MATDRKRTAPLSPSNPDVCDAQPPDLSVLDGDDGAGGWNPAKPIGKGNPPRATSWKKGCASPNPKGAPRRKPAGPYMTKFAQKIEGSDLTMGAALDRKIRALALQGNVRANKLLHARVAREVELARRRAEFEEHERKKADEAKRRPASFQQFEARRLFVDVLDKHWPGLLGAVLDAHELGLIDFRDGQYQIVEAVKALLQSKEG